MKKELLQAISDINKKYKSSLITVGTEVIYTDRIPLSSPRANYAIYGGIPIGKATELFGAEGGGKTTTALDIVANAQKYAEQELGDRESELLNRIDRSSTPKQRAELENELESLREAGPRRVLYIDAENTLDESWARLIGVDLDAMILLRPQDQTAEQVLQILLDVIDSGGVILAVLDSVPMLVSQSLFDETLEKKSYGGIAGVMTEFSRKVSSKISKHRTALVMINQVREDLNNPYNQYKTAGGMALKHLYALRIFCRKGSFLDKDGAEIPNKSEAPAGNMVDLSIVKTKICRQDRKVSQYSLMYETGIDTVSDCVYLAIKFGFIEQAGAWYRFDLNGQEQKFNGRGRLTEFLRSDRQALQDLIDRVNAEITDSPQ